MNDTMKRLSQLAQQAGELEEEIGALETEQKILKKRLRTILEKEIPSLMEDAGCEDFTTTSGLKITLKDVVRAAIPVSSRPEAYAWLQENGHGAIIKRTVAVGFAVDEESDAAQLEKILRSQYTNVRQEQKVEPSTLRAFVREQLEEGGELPLDLFGVFVQRCAKIQSN